ncbi:MAG: phosphoglycerate mutase family protein [Simkaniaceae bacterium]|nr:phosphoglycerate mutase family protein [Simkaniaceae bacterium]
MVIKSDPAYEAPFGSRVGDTTLFLVRHAQSWCNLFGIISSPELDHNKLGRVTCAGLVGICELARAFARREVCIDSVYSSMVPRAKETAFIFRGVFNRISHDKNRCFSNIIYDNRLREVGMGDSGGILCEDKNRLYGPKRDSIVEEHKVLSDRWKQVAVPGAESIADLQQRFFASLSEIGKNNIGKNVVVVTHGKAIAAFLGMLMDQSETDFHIKNCQVVRVVMTTHYSCPPSFDVTNSDWTAIELDSTYLQPLKPKQESPKVEKSQSCTLV